VHDDTAGLPDDALPGVSTATIMVVDTSAITDGHLEKAGFYVAVTAPYASDWEGYAMTDSEGWTRRRTDFDVAGSDELDRATMGSLYGALPNFSGGFAVNDTTTTFQIDFLFDRGDLASVPEADLMSATTNALLFENGEIIRFANVSFVGTNLDGTKRYSFDTLRRGVRGTEWAMGTHVSGEKVALIDPTALQRYEIGNNKIGQETTLQFKVSGVSGTTDIDFTTQGNSLKPYAPSNAAAVRNTGTNDVTFTWTRRSRVSGAGSNLPLGEESEKYELDIMNGGIVVRTLTSTTPTAVYTAAQQFADWGGVYPASISIRLYQMSAVVGRGYASEFTVPAATLSYAVSGVSNGWQGTYTDSGTTFNGAPVYQLDGTHKLFRKDASTWWMSSSTGSTTPYYTFSSSSTSVPTGTWTHAAAGPPSCTVTQV